MFVVGLTMRTSERQTIPYVCEHGVNKVSDTQLCKKLWSTRNVSAAETDSSKPEECACPIVPGLRIVVPIHTLGVIKRFKPHLLLPDSRKLYQSSDEC